MSAALMDVTGLPAPVALTEPIELVDGADPLEAALAARVAAYNPETQVIEAGEAPFIIAFGTRCVGICGTGRSKTSDIDTVSDD